MTEWSFAGTPLKTASGVELVPHEGDQPMTYLEVLNRWRDSQSFRQAFSAVIADAPYVACFWEVRPVALASANQPFAFVIVDSPALAGVRPNGRPFASYFGSGQPVVTFDNLGGDATLVVPAPGERGVDRFAHLADFLRSAAESQVHAFWQAVGDAVAERLSDETLWLSTSGLGVYWLHARLDRRPKYYTHAPYRLP